MTMSYIDSFVSHGCVGNCKQIGGSTHASERTTGELRRTRRTSNNSEQKCSSHKHMQQYGNTMQAVPPACSLWFANDLQQLISILWPPVLLFSSSVEPVTTALLLSTRHGVITVSNIFRFAFLLPINNDATTNRTSTFISIDMAHHFKNNNTMASYPPIDFGPHPLLKADDIDSNLAPRPHFLKSEAVRNQICMSDAGKLH